MPVPYHRTFRGKNKYGYLLPSSSKNYISRRRVIVALAGLVVGGGVAWEIFGHNQSAPAQTPHPLPVHRTLLDSPLVVFQQNEQVNSAMWSPDGKYITFASGDTSVRVWDSHTGHTIFVYRGHTDQVFSVQWSPDGKRIASGDGRGYIHIWNAPTGGDVYSYQIHTAEVYALAWSPDGKRIATGSADTTVQIWDASTGGNIYEYTGHNKPVLTVGWSPHGMLIASGGEDSTVQIWRAQ